MRFELTTLEVIGTDCTGSCKINYNGRCRKLFTRHGSPTTTPNRVLLVKITCMWSFIRDRIIVDLFVLCNQQTCKLREGRGWLFCATEEKHCVCPSSIYGFWCTTWYLQALFWPGLSPVDEPLGGDSGQLYYIHEHVFMLASTFVVALLSTYCSLICI
jgi:hypothetical protein